MKIILFSKVILLTPIPIDIEHEYTINYRELFYAINSKGCIEIDVTKMLPLSSDGNLVEELNTISKKFPPGSIKAELINSKTGNKVLLSKVSAATGDGWLRVVLMSETELPIDKKFDSVHLTTEIKLNNVQIFWRNGAI